MVSNMICGLCHEFTKKEIWFSHYILERNKDSKEVYFLFPVKIINGKAVVYHIWDGKCKYCLWEWGNKEGYKIYTTKLHKFNYIV